MSGKYKSNPIKTNNLIYIHHGIFLGGGLKKISKGVTKNSARFSRQIKNIYPPPRSPYVHPWLQYKRCVHFRNNFPCLTILARSEIAIECVLDCDYVSVSAFEWVWLCECVCVWVSECVCVKESVGCGLNSIVYSVECTGVNQLYIYNQREQYYLFTKWMNGWI